MDKKDQKILTELIINSRTPLNRLAKKVGLSREVVSYRFNNLQKDKIILSLYPIINTEALGYTRFTCFFRLKGISHEKENEFVEHLKDHNYVSNLGPVIGKWNIVFDLLSKSKDQFQKLITEITNYIQEYLESYIVIGTGSEQEIFPTKLLGVNKEIHYKETKKTKLNKTDFKILELMSNNSRIEYKEISKKLNLTANVIKYIMILRLIWILWVDLRRFRDYTTEEIMI